MQYESYLQHHGIKGQKWGVRRYQNSDGSLTDAGKKRYMKDASREIRRTGYAANTMGRVLGSSKVSNRRISKAAKSYVDWMNYLDESKQKYNITDWTDFDGNPHLREVQKHANSMYKSYSREIDSICRDVLGDVYNKPVKTLNGDTYGEHMYHYLNASMQAHAGIPFLINEKR